MASSVVIVIPSRYASTRFPGKPLALIRGKPMVQHVVERCLEAKCFDRVLVATDDARIAEAVRRFGGEVAMTSPACASGTDRVAEVARTLGLAGDSVVVNVSYYFAFGGASREGAKYAIKKQVPKAK